MCVPARQPTITNASHRGTLPNLPMHQTTNRRCLVITIIVRSVFLHTLVYALCVLAAWAVG